MQPDFMFQQNLYAILRRIRETDTVDDRTGQGRKYSCPKTFAEEKKPNKKTEIGSGNEMWDDQTWEKVFFTNEYV